MRTRQWFLGLQSPLKITFTIDQHGKFGLTLSFHLWKHRGENGSCVNVIQLHAVVCVVSFASPFHTVVVSLTSSGNGLCKLLQIRIHRPPDYSNILILGGLFVTISSLVYLKRRNLEFFYNKSAWATFTLVDSLSLSIVFSLYVLLLAW